MFLIGPIFGQTGSFFIADIAFYDMADLVNIAWFTARD